MRHVTTSAASGCRRGSRNAMDFGYSPEQEALRREVRAFIAENMDDAVRAAMDSLGEGFGVGPGRHAGSLVNNLFKKIGERGWLGISYPREYGGQGGDRMTQYIVEEEFTRMDIPVGMGGSGAPAIMAAGTEEQRQYYIPRLIKREVSFALGFTEPHA